jgi:pyruvate,water dikinase
MPYTVSLRSLNAKDLLAAGGKGANLGELVNAGFPVPPGFVLTTKAYQYFVQKNGLQPQIIDLARRASIEELGSSELSSEGIKDLFSKAQIPADIAGELISSYSELENETVAVRSSATAEDLPEASFAGQQDTFLNVQGKDALIEAVKQCWASLWTARAISYRMKQGIDPGEVSLAVVVQKLIPAESAGILFTANPVDGTREQIVINATWGLGESIVSGQVTPDIIIVDKSKKKIGSRETNTKTTMTVPTATGTENQPVPHSQQDQPVIDDPAAIELAGYGEKIESHYGLPMDIEWARSNGEFTILQARPITSLPPAPLKDVRWEPPRPDTVWMRRQVVEHMPEPLSPLFDELYLQNGLDRSMESMTEYMSDLSGTKINIWDFIDPPFTASVNGYAYSIASFNFSWQLIPLTLRVYITVLPKMIRHMVPRWHEHSVPAYQEVIEHWKSLDLPHASDEELLRGVREIAAEDAIYWFAAAVPLGFARISDGALNRFLKVVTGGRLTSGSLLRGFPSKAAEAQAQMEAIARKINNSEALHALVVETPAAQLLPSLADHPDGQHILDDFQGYLDTYGHQIYNLDFAAPTLADDPLPVLLSLKMAVTHPERDARTYQEKLAWERENLVAKTEEDLNLFTRPIFKKLWGWAERYSPYREEALFYVGAGWPTLRRLALELGQRLTEAGSLDTPNDVFYLESGALAAASAARADGFSQPELTKLARDRRALREARKRLDPPVAVPPDGKMKFGPISMSMFEPKPRTVSTGPVSHGSSQRHSLPRGFRPDDS